MPARELVLEDLELLTKTQVRQWTRYRRLDPENRESMSRVEEVRGLKAFFEPRNVAGWRTLEQECLADIAADLTELAEDLEGKKGFLGFQWGDPPWTCFYCSKVCSSRSGVLHHMQCKHPASFSAFSERLKARRKQVTKIARAVDALKELEGSLLKLLASDVCTHLSLSKNLESRRD